MLLNIKHNKIYIEPGMVANNYDLSILRTWGWKIPSLNTVKEI